MIYPPENSQFESRDASIIGNTCLYGATGGRLFASGVQESALLSKLRRACGDRGRGDHCCEYMTGGCVTVLGSTGLNFGAGMTGGRPLFSTKIVSSLITTTASLSKFTVSTVKPPKRIGISCVTTSKSLSLKRVLSGDRQFLIISRITLVSFGW